jgi:hypothetical protein
MSTTAARRSANHHVGWAAWSTIAGGVLQMAGGVINPPQGSLAAGAAAGLSSLSHLLLLAGMLGLWASGAMGRGRPAKGATWITVSAWAVLAVAEPMTLISNDVANVLFGIGTLGLAVGLVLAGITTLRTRLWTGWRRFTPLAAGLFLVVLVFPAFSLPGRDFEYVIAAWGASFVLLGVSMRAESAAAPTES